MHAEQQEFVHLLCFACLLLLSCQRLFSVLLSCSLLVIIYSYVARLLNPKFSPCRYRLTMHIIVLSSNTFHFVFAQSRSLEVQPYMFSGFTVIFLSSIFYLYFSPMDMDEQLTTTTSCTVSV